jgi:hypothetical protein
MEFKLLSFLIVFGCSLNVYSVTWSAKVVYPDREIKMYQFNDEPAELNLGKSQWKCSLSSVTTRTQGDLKGYSRWLDCKNGSLKAGTPAGCSSGESFSPPSTIFIGDAKDGRTVQFGCEAH